MDIQEFLDLCAGQWFSQRTSHQLEPQKAASSRTEMTVERLSQDCPELLTLCQYCQVEPSAAAGGLKARWESPAGAGQSGLAGSIAIAFVPDEGSPQAGRLLRLASNRPHSPLWGRYVLGEDEALTLTIVGENLYSEERLWFASPNLRLRTSLIKQASGLSTTAFYSEIRRIAS
jgi:hypothetical protein